MVKLRRKRISRSTVDAISVDRDTVFWDSELQGFGVRVYRSGRKVYIAQSRARGQPATRVTVGRCELISPTEARRRAAQIILRIKAGEEPVPTRKDVAVAGKGKSEQVSTRQVDPVREALVKTAERISDRIEKSLYRVLPEGEG